MLNFKEIGNVTYKQIDIMKHTIGFNRGRIRGTMSPLHFNRSERI